VIARPDLTQSQVDSLLNEVSALATKNGGKINSTENWGLRPLAYRMKKHRKAHYLYLEITLGREGLVEFQRVLGLHEDILRILIVAVPVFTAGPSAVVLNKRRDESGEGREERGGGRGFGGGGGSRDEGYRPRPRREASE
jgi:small subunit ribosomal protein S6